MDAQERYHIHRGGRKWVFSTDAHEVKQELPAEHVVLDQMSCDVHGAVRGKGHQEIRARNRQRATCDRERAEN